MRMKLKDNVVYKTLRNLPRPHRTGLILGSLFLGSLILLPSEPVEASRHQDATVLDAGVRYPIELSVSDSPDINFSEDDTGWHLYQVGSGDTLAKIFKRAGFSARDTYNVTQAGELAKTLVTLVPGDKLHLKADSTGAFAGLRYAISPKDTLVIRATDANGKMQADLESKEVETRYNFAQGNIDTSFWKAAVTAGLSNNQIMNLAGIFGWDIDFAMELRHGDTFSIVFEEQYIDGEFVGYGDIVAAEFVNQGETFTAIQHTDGNYYTPEGRSMRKSFLRAPINFKYVSSNFTKKRFHPVQKRWKSHNGTDYVAATGTPVMAAGDGRVIKASYNRFNGNYVFVQHGEKYVTKYLHFKSKAVKTGETVKQGQVIGYLGSTGMVTGAHLHYEFLVDGVHRNPRTVELPKAEPIASSQREAFMQIADNRLAQLKNNKRVMLAMQ
ncbi:peptidoglycan DD-metalloendopeptidase family protein [Salinimonas sp. HHU 13199]|uniref:Peptidoglycan DD-metalloendopeptidase family protein n=1 Tax=Salinimonas profundi TaxID=2729140 RepID=A0ABR8LMA7_9ALTE|nr:peptidoglycan DD-metalloendopeptidase family protein [Salinimonas profundi]MBD3586191.1 peptidoglycan DD-metalloendopeptidase family protein [Salinimonas profundi]